MLSLLLEGDTFVPRGSAAGGFWGSGKRVAAFASPGPELLAPPRPGRSHRGQDGRKAALPPDFPRLSHTSGMAFSPPKRAEAQQQLSCDI